MPRKKEVKKSEDTVKGLGIVGYVLGILSVVFALISPLAGLVMGIVGIVHTNRNQGVLAKRSRILNIIGIVASFIMAILAVYISYSSGSSLLTTP